jgi:hypothetical protein
MFEVIIGSQSVNHFHESYASYGPYTNCKAISQFVYGPYGFVESWIFLWAVRLTIRRTVGIDLGNKHLLMETTYCVYELIRIVTCVYRPYEFDDREAASRSVSCRQYWTCMSISYHSVFARPPFLFFQHNQQHDTLLLFTPCTHKVKA